MKYLAIVGSNLDEFFMKRVGGLKRQVDAGVRSLSVDGRTPREQLEIVRTIVVKMVSEQRRCLLDILLPKLEKEGIRLLNQENLDEQDRAFLRGYYQRTIFPILTPLAIDPGTLFLFSPISACRSGCACATPGRAKNNSPG